MSKDGKPVPRQWSRMEQAVPAPDGARKGVTQRRELWPHAQNHCAPGGESRTDHYQTNLQGTDRPLPIVTLNINGRESSLKSYRLMDGSIKKDKPGRELRSKSLPCADFRLGPLCLEFLAHSLIRALSTQPSSHGVRGCMCLATLQPMTGLAQSAA